VNCGKFWTHDECLEFGPPLVRNAWLRFKCSEQTLNGGPFLPPDGCGPADGEYGKDYCALLNA
jgi:hypothetical protein